MPATNAVSKRCFIRHRPACIPLNNQEDPLNPKCTEDSAYPAMQTYVARYHNIFGPQGTWTGGREKAPAAICRKVAMARSGEDIEVWGDGEQTRSFLYIDECVEGTVRLLRSNFAGPVNI